MVYIGLLVGVLLGGMGGFFIWRKKCAENKKEIQKKSIIKSTKKNKTSNISRVNKKRKDKRTKNIEELIHKINEKGQITNDDVQKMLNVSDATATRYLEILEKKGTIKQVGKKGRGVKYKL